jgi:hypothetical protein
MKKFEVYDSATAHYVVLRTVDSHSTKTHHFYNRREDSPVKRIFTLLSNYYNNTYR